MRFSNAAAWGMAAVGVALLVAPRPRAASADEKRGGSVASPRIELAAPGSEPRRLLALAPRAGTVQTFEARAEVGQTVRVGSREFPTRPTPPMLMRVEFAVDDVARNGDIALRAVCGGMELPPDIVISDTRRRGFAEADAMLRGATQHLLMSRHGVVKSARLEFADYLPADVEKRLADLLEQLLPRGFQAQPPEAVGAGARWRASWTVDDVFASRFVADVEIVRLDETGYELAVALEQTAEEQDLPAEAFPRADGVRLLSAKGQGRGRVVQRFDEVAPRELSFTLDVSLDLTVGRDAAARAVRREDHVSIRGTSQAARPAAPAGAPSGDPPSAQEALSAARAILAAVRSPDMSDMTQHVDHVAVLRGVFGERLDSMTPEERDELQNTHGPAVARQVLDITWLRAGLGVKGVTIGEPRALPPRGRRTMVTFRVEGEAEARDVRWLFQKSGGRTLLVDAMGRDSLATAAARSMSESLMETRLNPLDVAREMLGLPPDLAGRARKMRIEVPVIPAAPEPARGDGRPVLHLLVGKWGRVHVRTAGSRPQSVDLELGSDDPAEQQKARDELRDVIARGHGSGARDQDGRSRLRVLVRADRRARWRYVHWMVQACRSLGMGDLALEVTRPDGSEGTVALDPPAGAGRGLFEAPGAAVERGPAFVVKLLRKNVHDKREAHTLLLVAVDDTRYLLPQGWRGRTQESPQRVAKRDAVFAAFAAHVGKLVQALGGEAKRVTCRFEMRPPTGLSVPVADVLRAVHGARSAGVGRVEVGAAEDLELDLDDEEEEVEEGK